MLGDATGGVGDPELEIIKRIGSRLVVDVVSYFNSHVVVLLDLIFCPVDEYFYILCRLLVYGYKPYRSFF